MSQRNLDSIASKYIRKWLDLPVCATLSNIFLPQNRFGLNICPPSVKFSEGQTSYECLTKCNKIFTNDDIKTLWRDTSHGANLQYDSYRNTKEALNAFRSEQEERLTAHLVSQGSFFSTVITQAMPKLNSVWSIAQKNLPKDIFNFKIRYMNNTLPSKKNLCKWGLSSTSDCSFCLQPESLLHIVAGCSKYLNEGRYTWRHNSVLHFIAYSMKSVPDSVLYADLPGFVTPSVATGDTLRPDLLLAIFNKCLYILELTVGFENNLLRNFFT